MLCNALIHFDYACSACYPNLNVKLKKTCKINAFVSAWNLTKCIISLKKISKQLIGCLLIKVREIIMLGLRFLFVKLTWGRKVSHIFVPQSGTNCQIQWKETLAEIRSSMMWKKLFTRIKDVILLLWLSLLLILLSLSF